MTTEVLMLDYVRLRVSCATVLFKIWIINTVYGITTRYQQIPYTIALDWSRRTSIWAPHSEIEQEGCCVLCWGCLYMWFMPDMLDNHEDDEERPQKKKRKLSNSQENNNNNQDISFIKVPALYNGHCPKLIYFYIKWIEFINFLDL